MFGRGRVTRDDLNKDLGPIGRSLGGEGVTRRGAINGNFARAVAAAIEDTTDKWAYFKNGLIARFGADAGKTMICAMAHDTFDKAACEQEKTQESVCTAREVYYFYQAEVPMDLVAPTEAELSAAAANLPALRSYCRTEESDVARIAVVSGGKADQGRALATTRALNSLALWSACPVHARRGLSVADRDDGKTTHADRAQGETKGAKAVDLLATNYANCVLSAHLRHLESRKSPKSPEPAGTGK